MLTSNLRSHDTFPIRIWELTFYIFIALSGILGNGLILTVLRGDKNMRSSAFGIYIGALSLADILVCILCVPIYLTSTSWFKYHPTGTAGDAMCKTFTGYNILFLFATVSVYTMVAISYERYIAICHPFLARVKLTPKRAKIAVAIIWAFSFLLGLLSIIGERVSTPELASVGAHCTFSNAYNNDIAPKVVYVVVFTIQYISPIIFMVICFVKIKRELHIKKMQALHSPTAHVQNGELAAVRIRRKSVQTVLIVITSYFLCWSMNQALYFCLNFGFIGIKWNGTIMQISVLLCFFSSCINPFIYAVRSKHFRDGFAKILCCYQCKRKRNDYAELLQ